MLIHWTRCFAIAAAVSLLLGSTVQAAVITVPSGLNPGDQYRLVFVTSFGNTRDATSTDIADYNAFVSGVAAGVPELNALGTTWTAIASTTTVDARDNTSTTSTGVPIYRLDDVLIAANNADLWNGTVGDRIWIDENGNIAPGVVWTGTQTDGTAFPSRALGEPLAQNGSAASTDFNWISSGEFENTISLQFYAISDILTVQEAAVPEPSTLALGLAGLAAAAGIRWRRRSR